MVTRRTRILLILAGVPLVCVGVLVAAVLLIPAERVAALAARHAEAALGREVRLDRVSLDFFPTPGIVLEGVAIGRSAPDAAANATTPSDSAPPLATVRRVVLRPQLLALLGRRVVVDAVVLQHPLLLLEVDSAADLRLPEQDTASASVPEPGGTNAAFAVQSFRIEDGRIGYLERATGTVIRLNGVDQQLELSGALQQGELVRVEAAGELTIEDVDAVLPGRLATPIRDLRVRVVHDAVLDQVEDRLTIHQLALELGDLALEGNGAVYAVSDSTARRVELRLAAGPVDVADVTSLASIFRRTPAATAGPETGAESGSAPAAAEPPPQPDGTSTLPEVSGQVSIEAVVDGPLTPDTLPEVRGTLSLAGLSVAFGEMDPLVEQLDGTIAFSLDSLASQALTGRLLGEPLRLSFRVQDFAAPVAHVSVRTALDLARADAVGLLPDSMDGRGRATVDVSLRAPVLEPARASLDGGIGLAGLTVQPTGLLQPVVVSEGRIDLHGQVATGEDIVLRMGQSDLTLDFEMRDWLPQALGDTSVVPAATFDARSRLFDGDALFGVDSVGYGGLLFARLADRPVGGKTAAEQAEAAGMALPALPPLTLEGRFRAATFRRGGLELRDVDVIVAGSPHALAVRSARFGLMGGIVQLTAQIEVPNDAAAAEAGAAASGQSGAAPAVGFPTTLQFRLEDVGAAPFFNTFTPFQEHLSGSLALTGTASLVLDRNLLPRRESVAARGTLGLSGGYLQNWTVLEAVGLALGLASFDTLAVDDWAGHFNIVGPRVAISESVLASEALDATVAGTFDFGGHLDLGATLQLSPALAARTGRQMLVRLANAAAGAEDDIPVGLRITGAVEDPAIGLDLSTARQNVTAAARAKAEAEARALAERAVQELEEELRLPSSLLDMLRPDSMPRDTLPPDSVRPDTLPPADSPALRADSAQTRLQRELRERVRGTIRKN